MIAADASYDLDKVRVFSHKTKDVVVFFFKQKTAYEIGLGIPAEPLFRSCILTKNVITSCSVTMMLFLHLEVKPLMTLTTVLYLSCALISGHLAMMLMELTKRR